VLLLASTLLLLPNWFLFIYAVGTGQVLLATLSNFLMPICNVMLGLLLFRERLHRGQWLALALALAGLASLVLAVGNLPWIALALVNTFFLYGLIHKCASVEPLVGLAVETFVLLPFAAGCLSLWAAEEGAVFIRQDVRVLLLLPLSGLVTASPLLCFGEAVQRLRLSKLAFLQYLVPTLQLLVFHEPLLPGKSLGFVLIWLALLVFSLEPVLARRPVCTSH
jgi:chloramphenicol-sensitive protein RarD